jgi:hypothetical protein
LRPTMAPTPPSVMRLWWWERTWIRLHAVLRQMRPVSARGVRHSV